MEVDNTRAIDDDGFPWYVCRDCKHKGPPDDLDIEESTIKCGICGSKSWQWL